MAAAALLLIAGCGGGSDSPTRYHISGSVTHKGAPLAAGVIYFNPQDGANPSGFAAIVDGKYDTAVRTLRDQRRFAHGNVDNGLRLTGWRRVALCVPDS